MEKRCANCMELLENNVCPNCNFKADEKATQTVLKNRYFLGNVFLKTTDSIIYIAYDNELNKKVFVREFNSENILKLCENESKENLTRRFLSYAKSTAGLSLCNILPRTVDTFLENEIAYWVTDYFDGTSLKNLFASEVKISAQSALDIATQLLKGLRNIHSSGSVFGAISPKTVYLLKNGEVRLFGIGGSFYGFTDDVNCLAELLNPSYAAPELFISPEKTSPKSDVYSVAAILYRIITGEIPPISFLRSGGDNLLFVKTSSKNVTPAIKCALLNALNWQKENRTKSADMFLKELSAPTVKRRLSGKIIWANILGLLQNVFDKSIVKYNDFSKAAAPKIVKAKAKIKSLLWLWITIPAVILAVVIALFLINYANNKISGENNNSEEWYYGSGIETPNENSTYSYGGYTSKKQTSSKESESSLNENPSEDNETSTSSLPAYLTECPDLVNYHINQAEYAVKDSSLLLGEITYEYSNEITKDYVISQSINSGDIVKKASIIDIVVSKGPKKLNLPDVFGLSMQKAVETLENSGFKNISFNFVSSGDAAGTVTSANFENKNDATYNSKVIITVSGERAEVLNYKNKTVDEIKNSESDFVFEFKLEDGNALDQNADYTKYTVVSQSAEKNTPAYKGMTITLTVVALND